MSVVGCIFLLLTIGTDWETRRERPGAGEPMLLLRRMRGRGRACRALASMLSGPPFLV